MSTLQNYVDKISHAYDEDMFLGYLVWYTITEDTEIEHAYFVSELVRQLDDIVDVFLPPAPRPVDVFKRACTKAQRKNQRPVDDTHAATNYMIRNSGHSPGKIWKTLVREHVDVEGHELEYQQLFRAVFNRSTNTISLEWENVEAISDDIAVDISDTIEAYFEKYQAIIGTYSLREYVRNLLRRQVLAVQVRPGVYFVNGQYGQTINAISDLINGLPSNAEFHILPLVDDSKQRQMLKAAFEEDSIGEIDGLLGEISEIIKQDKKVTKGRFADFKASFDTVRKRVLEYSDLLDEAMENTASRLEVADTMLFELIGRIK